MEKFSEMLIKAEVKELASKGYNRKKIANTLNLRYNYVRELFIGDSIKIIKEKKSRHIKVKELKERNIEQIRNECKEELRRFKWRIGLTKSLSQVDIYKLIDLFEVYNNDKLIDSKPVEFQVEYMWKYLQKIN